MNVIEILAPHVEAHAIEVTWAVTPASPVYARTSFRIEFPASVDVREVPEALWWTVLISCLCPTWLFAQPCRVLLPVRLQPGEREAWLHWLELQWQSLEAYRGHAAGTPAIDIVEGTQRLPVPSPRPDTGRCATAFSGGKDSLLQAALLTEFTKNPLLVAVTMPLPELNDHTSARRRQVFAEMRRRRPQAELVEVHSTFRTCWNNNLSREAGFPVSITETTDTHLYAGALAVVGWVRGATHLFLASETDVQEVVEREGRLVFHPHMMYSFPPQQLFAALIAPVGLRYGSLTWPLRSGQVQELLWRRYPDLRDLQYSCWRLGAEEAACSRCSQCLRLALCALALGKNPETMGIDLVRLMAFASTWTPRYPPVPDAAPPLPSVLVGQGLDAQVWRSVRRTPAWRLLAARCAGRPSRWLASETWRLLTSHRRLRALAATYPATRAPGYRAGFLAELDPCCRTAVVALYRRYFREEPVVEHAATLALLRRAVSDLTHPLATQTVALPSDPLPARLPRA